MWTSVIRGRNVKTAFVEEKKRFSEGFSDPVGEHDGLDIGCLDFWTLRSLTKGS